MTVWIFFFFFLQIFFSSLFSCLSGILSPINLIYDAKVGCPQKINITAHNLV